MKQLPKGRGYVQKGLLIFQKELCPNGVGIVQQGFCPDGVMFMSCVCLEIVISNRDYFQQGLCPERVSYV